MEFQFGTNWSEFARAGGDFFGHMLGYEAAMAFMLEASFIGIMILGWKRVSPAVHLFATSMVAFGASLSAFWIMVANSWMQTPRGGFFDKGKFVLTSHLEAIFNPDMVWSVPHMWVAALEISLFVVGGLSAWYLYKNRHTGFFLTSFKWAAVAAIVITPLQIWLGDGSGRMAYLYDPSKLAAFEAHWHTNPPGEGAPFSILAWPDPEIQDNRWSIEVPTVLSLLTTHTTTGQIKGLRDFPREDQPPVAITYYAFRSMVAIGTALFLLMLWTVWVWRKGGLDADAGVFTEVAPPRLDGRPSPQLSRHGDRLADPRDRPAALGHPWDVADRGIGFPDSRPNSGRLARCLCPGLCLSHDPLFLFCAGHRRPGTGRTAG